MKFKKAESAVFNTKREKKPLEFIENIIVHETELTELEQYEQELEALEALQSLLNE